jgi:hypothetical protein
MDSSCLHESLTADLTHNDNNEPRGHDTSKLARVSPRRLHCSGASSDYLEAVELVEPAELPRIVRYPDDDHGLDWR